MPVSWRLVPPLELVSTTAMQLTTDRTLVAMLRGSAADLAIDGTYDDVLAQRCGWEGAISALG